MSSPAPNPVATAKADKIFTQVENQALNLYSRWLDEKDYEDIADYGEGIRPRIEAGGGKLLKMTKRPFGFIVDVDGCQYAYRVTATQYSFRRVA